MHKPLAERILSFAIGTPRAAALYGDLEELAPTRGRLWFWTAYIRTLISLGWRTGASAFFLAFLCARSNWINTGLFQSMHRLFRWLPRDHRAWHIYFWTFPLANTLLGLVFLLPFVLIRFGLRDRLTQLTCAMFLLILPFFSLNPPVVEFVFSATAIAVLATLCVREWRRPMIILSLTLSARYAIFQVESYTHRHHPWTSHPHRDTAFQLLELGAVAILCIALHRRLLQPKSPGSGSVLA